MLLHQLHRIKERLEGISRREQIRITLSQHGTLEIELDRKEGLPGYERAKIQQSGERYAVSYAGIKSLADVTFQQRTEEEYSDALKMMLDQYVQCAERRAKTSGDAGTTLISRSMLGLTEGETEEIAVFFMGRFKEKLS